jgi:hypothetical protein
VQARVVSLEVQLEPVAQFARELGVVQLLGRFELLGNIAYLVEQAVVVRLVLRLVDVVMANHHLLFEREMGRNTAIDFAQAVDHEVTLCLVGNQCVHGIDLVDKALVLVIHPLDPGAVFFSPFKQRHLQAPV